MLSQGASIGCVDGKLAGESCCFLAAEAQEDQDRVLIKLKEDNQNVNAGGLAIECCRQFEALFPHVTYFLPMVDSSDLKVAGFLLVAGTQ